MRGAKGEVHELHFSVDATGAVTCLEQLCELTGGQVRIVGGGPSAFSNGRDGVLRVVVTPLDDDYPETIGLLVTLGDVAVYEETHQMVYRVAEPNGEGCGDVRDDRRAVMRALSGSSR